MEHQEQGQPDKQPTAIKYPVPEADWPEGFHPCASDCPAVSGNTTKTIRYCPVLEKGRHDNWKDWFDRLPNALRTQESVTRWHEDYTYCCLNFQCCFPGGL